MQCSMILQTLEGNNEKSETQHKEFSVLAALQRNSEIFKLPPNDRCPSPIDNDNERMESIIE
jgi:hypothetical protein